MTKHVAIPFLVYHQSDLPDVAHTYTAGAHEAGGYLRFIAEYYDCLPEVPAAPTASPCARASVCMP